MKEHPILFSAPMVRAILDGRKTQTRRVVKGMALDWLAEFTPEFVANPENHLCPFGQVGDRLWVRETFAVESNFNLDDESNYPPPFRDDRPIRRVEDDEYFGSYWQQCHYRASDPKPELVDTDGNFLGWKPSIFMPRWASRITLEISDIRIERVRDISEPDAKSEGAELGRMIGYGAILEKSYKEGFLHLWNEINPKTGFDAWVWVITFIRL